MKPDTKGRLIEKLSGLQIDREQLVKEMYDSNAQEAKKIEDRIMKIIKQLPEPDLESFEVALGRFDNVQTYKGIVLNVSYPLGKKIVAICNPAGIYLFQKSAGPLYSDSEGFEELPKAELLQNIGDRILEALGRKILETQ